MSTLVASLRTEVGKLGLPRTLTLDLLSVSFGIRGMALIHVPSCAVTPVEALFKKYGYRIEGSRTYYRVDDVSTPDSVFIESVGLDADKEYWAEYFVSSVSGPYQLNDRLDSSASLGYPVCCSNSYSKISHLSDIYSRYIADPIPFSWQVNRVSRLFSGELMGPDFFPCSMHCHASVSLLLKFHELYVKIYGSHDYILQRRLMMAPLTVINGHLVRWPSWSKEGETLNLFVADSMSIPVSRVGGGAIYSELSPFRLIIGNHYQKALLVQIHRRSGEICKVYEGLGEKS